jgi:adenosine deaminase
MDDYDFTTLPVAGPGAEALSALTLEQISFLRDLPKAELHAHLNGSIPLPVLQKLAQEHGASTSTVVGAGIERLQNGVTLDTIHDFFNLFPAIYELTAAREPLARATCAVLEHFLGGRQPQAAYLELRTTPKSTEHMGRRGYLETVLDEVEKYSEEKVALIVSLDRRMDAADAREVVNLAIQLKGEGRRVVAVDLCGDPLVHAPAYLWHAKSYFQKSLGQ